MMISQASCHHGFLSGSMHLFFSKPDTAVDFQDSFLSTYKQQANYTYGLNMIGLSYIKYKTGISVDGLWRMFGPLAAERAVPARVLLPVRWGGCLLSWARKL
jgi:hypothetical protein